MSVRWLLHQLSPLQQKSKCAKVDIWQREEWGQQAFRKLKLLILLGVCLWKKRAIHFKHIAIEMMMYETLVVGRFAVVMAFVRWQWSVLIYFDNLGTVEELWCFYSFYFCKTGWFNCRKKSGKIKTEYKRDYLHTNCDLDFDFAGPTIHSAAVLGWVEFRYRVSPYQVLLLKLCAYLMCCVNWCWPEFCIYRLQGPRCCLPLWRPWLDLALLGLTVLCTAKAIQNDEMFWFEVSKVPCTKHENNWQK